MHDGTIYMYLDEAGNFDFSPKGSKFFIMTAVVAKRPFAYLPELLSLKYDCYEEQPNPKTIKDYFRFHASEDLQATRDKVFEIISNNLADLAIFSVIIRKNKTNPILRDEQKLYQSVFQWLVGYASRNILSHGFKNIVVITKSIKVKHKNAALKQGLKQYMNERFSKQGHPYRLYQFKSCSDLNLQIADYCCWAIQRKWERGDERSYDLIKDAIRAEGDLFKNGDTVYCDFE